MDPNVRKIKRAIIGEASEVSVDSQGRIAVNAELWERIFAKAGDEICVFNDDGKLDICSKSFYENEDHDLSNIEAAGYEVLCQKTLILNIFRCCLTRLLIRSTSSLTGVYVDCTAGGGTLGRNRGKAG